MGLGLGLVMAPAMSTATLGVDRRDPGLASAMITGQQIGGSIGTALLSTLACGAAHSDGAAHSPAADLLAQAAVHGYTRVHLVSRHLRPRRSGLLAAAAQRRTGTRAGRSRRTGLRSLKRSQAQYGRAAVPLARPFRLHSCLR
jgi:hypothetical protein